MLSEATDIPVEEFTEAAKDPVALGVPDFWFTRSDGRATSEKSLEGFLYPDTYNFDPGLDAKQLLGVMVKRFLAVTTEIGFVEKVESGLDITPYDALMVASLSQSEGGIASDFPKVSRVIYNTLFKPNAEIGFKPVLRLDVTLNYGFMKKGDKAKASGKLTAAELADGKNRGTRTSTRACRRPRSATRASRRSRPPRAPRPATGTSSSPSTRTPRSPRSPRPSPSTSATSRRRGRTGRSDHGGSGWNWNCTRTEPSSGTTSVELLGDHTSAPGRGDRGPR